MNSRENKLKAIRNQIEEAEFNLKICDSHITFMHEMSLLYLKDKCLKKDYENQLAKDAFRRMELQHKLKVLMEESFKIQEVLNSDNQGLV